MNLPNRRLQSAYRISRRITDDPRRVAAAVAVGFASAAYAVLILQHRPGKLLGMDFTYPWLAARALALRLDPYQFVIESPVPGTHTLFYPAVAGLVALPFAAFPVRLAAILFVGVGCGWLAYHFANDLPWRLVLFASAPVVQACSAAQWSPFLTAASLTSAAGLTIAKPNLAIPLLVHRWSRRQSLLVPLIVAAVLCLITLVISPDWPIRWLKTIRDSTASDQYRAPILTLAGGPLVLALLRWRRADARLLFTLACMPQNAFFYDQLPLLLIPANRAEYLGVTIASVVALLVASLHSPMTDAAAWSAHFRPFVLAGMYLPALILVLRRPNTEAVV